MNAAPEPVVLGCFKVFNPVKLRALRAGRFRTWAKRAPGTRSRSEMQIVRPMDVVTAHATIKFQVIVR